MIEIPDLEAKLMVETLEHIIKNFSGSQIAIMYYKSKDEVILGFLEKIKKSL